MNLCTANNGTQKLIFEGFGKKDNIVETPKAGDVNIEIQYTGVTPDREN